MAAVRFIILCIALATGIAMSSTVKVYFSPDDKLDRRILQAVSEARSSIHIASFSYQFPELDSLLRLRSRDRNCDVRVLVNSAGFSRTDAVSNRYIKVIGTGGRVLHAKFMVVDSRRVFVGSGNFTTEGLTRDANDILEIDDEVIAAAFENEFKALWSGRDGIEGASSGLVEIRFSPQSDCESAIIREVERAKRYIHFAAFAFTSDEIANQLCRTGMHGVKVCGIFEKSQGSDYSEYEYLKRLGFNVRQDLYIGQIHHKFIVIDDDVVLTGSFNFTKKAKNNVETFLVIRDGSVVNRYLKRWRYLNLFY